MRARVAAWGGLVLVVGLVGAWFLQQDPDLLNAWVSALRAPSPPPPRAAPMPPPVPSAPRPPPVAEPVPSPVAEPLLVAKPPPVERPPGPPPPRRKRCLALTWAVLSTEQGTVTMGSVTGQSDPYRGDTPCSESRPLLCIKPGSAPPPKGVESVPYRGWTGGEVAATKPILGLEVRSLEDANRMCAAVFGEGWRMGAFHDGGGWGLKAWGTIPVKTRLWVTIADQRANLWD